MREKSDFPVSVYLRCDVGGYHGLGHLARMQVLANYLSSKTSFKPVLIFATQNLESIQAKLATTKAELVQAPEYLHQEDGWTFDWIDRRQAATGRPAVIVFDQKDISVDFPSAFNKLGVTVCVDDDNYRSFDCDILVNPNPWVKRSDYRFARSQRTEVLVGRGVHFVDQHYLKQRGMERFASKHPHVLVTMGGEDPHNHSSWILKNCAGVLSNIPVDVVVGPSHPNAAQLEADARKYVPQATLHYRPSNLIKLVERASCAITAGGQTCFELLASGVPSVGVVVEEHQRSLIEFFVAEGALLYGADHSFEAGDVLCNVTDILLRSERVCTRLRDAGYGCFPDGGVAPLIEAIERKMGTA